MSSPSLIVMMELLVDEKKEAMVLTSHIPLLDGDDGVLGGGEEGGHGPHMSSSHSLIVMMELLVEEKKEAMVLNGWYSRCRVVRSPTMISLDLPRVKER